MEIILWDFLMFYQIFLSLQVKRSTIIINKQGVYELPNNLTLRILGNKEKSGKSGNVLEWWTRAQNEKFFNTSQKLLKNRYWTLPAALFHTKTRVCLKYPLSDCRFCNNYARNGFPTKFYIRNDIWNFI